MKTVNDIMEFDRVIEVHEDGSITDRNDLYAPSLLDGIVSDGWELLNGYSGQQSYTGPIMHESEFIGGDMARDILDTPGIYVALVSCNSDLDTEDETGVDGWAVARLKKR